jgi:hypothetical protein
MKMTAVSFSESPANFHQTAPRHIPEENTFHTHYREVLLYCIHEYVLVCQNTPTVVSFQASAEKYLDP